MGELEATPMPVPALYRKARAQALSRYKNIIRDIDEAIAYEQSQLKV